MDKFWNFYNKNKKLVNIALIIIVISIVSLIIVMTTTKDNENDILDNPEPTYQEKLVLFGPNLVQINQGDKYIEPGFYALSETGEIIRNNITVDSNLDTSKPGKYTIKYSYKNSVMTRTVEVIEVEKEPDVTIESVVTFNLKGNSMMVIDQGSEFIDPLYEAYDSNGVNYNDKVKVTGTVDASTPGTYLLTYTLELENLDKRELTRQVIVRSTIIDATITLDNTNYTNENVTATIDVIGDSFSYVRYPDNTYSEDKTSKYIIKENGTYTFYIYNSNYDYITKEITVNNIDKDSPTGTCSANYKVGKTTVNVSVNDSKSGIKNYNIYGDNKLLLQTTLTSYSVNNKLTSAYIVVYDNAGNSKQINCSMEKSYDLEVHFINVGREDAIVIRDNSKTIFIDGGSYNKGSKITKYLQNLGVTHIDALIGSHLHYNHIQAQAVLLKNFSVDKIYYAQDLNTCYSKYCDKADQKYILSEIKKQKKEITIMKVGNSIDIGDMNIFCIGPISFQTKSQNIYRQNYNSLNFILTYGNTKFLFTGDEVQYSNILKKFDKSILDIDVLKYPHHGNASLGKTFVNAISPKYVILTNSRDELSSRSEKTYLKNVGASFYYSYKHGNILVTSDGETVSIKTKVSASNYKR